jgi:hypothetical protein
LSRFLITTILTVILLTSFPIKADENHAPSITVITGNTKCKMNNFYNYTFSAIDPDDDEIFYLIHWGDGIVYYWIGPYNSGEKITISYCYQLMPNQKSDEIIISARAKDIHEACGEWGYLNVAILKNYQIISSKTIFRFQNYFLINLIEEYLGKIITISDN